MIPLGKVLMTLIVNQQNVYMESTFLQEIEGLETPLK